MKLPREEVVKIASAQKMLLWTILAAIVINIAVIAVRINVLSQPGVDRGVAMMFASLSSGLVLLVLVLQIVSVVRLCSALREGWATAIYAVCQIIPCVSLILLLFLNGRATKRLQECGIRVGLMGANATDVANYQPQGGRTCSGCGEQLDESVTTCPVCGAAVGA